MILAIDTATRWAGLALHDGTAVIAEAGWRSYNNHTVELSPAIGDMLTRARITMSDLKGIAVAIGPGSYTGLRVGLALAKGLALANQTPLLGTPTLDILAAAFGPLDGQLLVAAEAGRGRVCAALFRWQTGRGWQAQGEPVIESWEEILAGLAGPTTFTGEITPAAAKLIRVTGKHFHLASPAASVRRAGYLAEIGWQRLRKGQVDDASALAPIYLRDPAGK
jgi:tRNA threonylcarbamoyladenosine biosynthesis protein TsaB